MFFGENDEFGGLSMLQTSKVVKIVVQKVVAKGCFTEYNHYRKYYRRLVIQIMISLENWYSYSLFMNMALFMKRTGLNALAGPAVVVVCSLLSVAR